MDDVIDESVADRTQKKKKYSIDYRLFDIGLAEKDFVPQFESDDEILNKYRGSQLSFSSGQPGVSRLSMDEFTPPPYVHQWLNKTNTLSQLVNGQGDGNVLYHSVPNWVPRRAYTAQGKSAVGAHWAAERTARHTTGGDKNCCTGQSKQQPAMATIGAIA
uniref:Uncharacterized protein n=1 Tax=Romanomermis culicivorax TaxID=13658 RepID=A0A915IBP1_ROMCU